MTFIRRETRTADKRLFTPGPLTTSHAVKAAMLRDLGSRDRDFITCVQDIRAGLLRLAGYADDSLFTAIPMQGSGTFGIESVIGSVVPTDGKLLVLVNGAYGRRMDHIARTLKIDTVRLACAENEVHRMDELDQALRDDPAITTVAAVHCETTSGILNRAEAIGPIVHRHGKGYVLDAMSSFGAIPIDLDVAHVDYLVSSSNKCIEGVPGFSFILARGSHLETIEGFARSVSLDMVAQLRGLQNDGQFRFTPPVQSMLAFRQALIELEEEGGVAGRGARYRANHERLVAGTRAIGLREFVPQLLQAPIITTYLYPEHPAFSFERLYEGLNRRGFVIYPGKLTTADCFRIGNIGRIDTQDIDELLIAITETLTEMGVPCPITN